MLITRWVCLIEDFCDHSKWLREEERKVSQAMETPGICAKVTIVSLCGCVCVCVCVCVLSHYSETSKSRLSEMWTIFVQQVNPMSVIDLAIEIVHLEPPRSRHLSTLKPAWLQILMTVCTK